MNTVNLSALWNSVIAELECATDRWNVTVDPAGHNGDYKADEDDQGMATASDDDLIGWCDDLESRIGMDVEDMRDAIADYCAARKEAQA